MNSIVELKNISKTYASSRVLTDVNFSLKPGEVHALVGENGAGKTTLIKILAGNVQADEGGTILFDGQPVEKMSVLQARNFGISVIYQDISLFPNMTVAENISFGTKKHGLNRWKDIYRLARKTFETLSIDIDPSEMLGKLSIGQQQLVAIARALATQTKVVIMDEPTSSLSGSDTKNLYSIIDNLKRLGIGIIYISHKFDEVFYLADRITVLRDGHLVAEGDRGEFDSNNLIRLMVGRELQSLSLQAETISEELVFSVHNLTNEPFFRDTSFTVKKHEIFGITGLVGAGRSELAQTIFGLLTAQSGEIYLGNELNPIKISDAGEAIKKGICYLPEDRHAQGLLMSKSLRENISIANLENLLNRCSLISFEKENNLADSYIKKLNIKPAQKEMQLGHFSGGNQQKVLVARWLNANPKVLIVDEVTSGVDVGARLEIHKLLRALAQNGIGVILISSDLSEIMTLTDRVMIFRQGCSVGILNTKSVSQETILEKCFLG